MDRKSLREFTHKAGQLLTIDNLNYKQWVFRYTFLELEKDLGTNGDITSEIVCNENKRITATITAKEDGILAGREETEYFLIKSDPNFKPGIRGEFEVKFNFQDGEKFHKGDVIMTINGLGQDVMAVERTVLNLLMHMSGIAALTAKLVEQVGDKVLICPTRKTTWGLLDKKAVILGGGGTHRINLSDAILVKENHLAQIGDDFEVLMEKLTTSNKTARFCEIEVETKAQALELSDKLGKLVKSGQILQPVAILFDNMSPEEVTQTISELKTTENYNHILYEASGGINEKNLQEYAKTGVDIISMGCLTNGVKTVDMSLKVE